MAIDASTSNLTELSTGVISKTGACARLGDGIKADAKRQTIVSRMARILTFCLFLVNYSDQRIESAAASARSATETLAAVIGNLGHFQMDVANRDYHYLSHPEIASDKRISQQLFPLSGPGGQNLAEERLNRDCLSGALLS